MKYNKGLLESWIDDSDDEADIEATSDVEVREVMWDSITRCHRLNRRIEYCESLLKENKDAFLCYVLAKLYANWEYGYCRQILHMRPVRYYSIMAIRLDRNYVLAWAFLSVVYRWLAVVERAKNYIFEGADLTGEAQFFADWFRKQNQEPGVLSRRNWKLQIKYIEKAIYCIKKAMQKDSSNRQYRAWLKFYYQERNEIYSSRRGI